MQIHRAICAAGKASKAIIYRSKQINRPSGKFNKRPLLFRKRSTATLLAAALTAALLPLGSSAFADITVEGSVSPIYPGDDPWELFVPLYVGELSDGNLTINHGSVVSVNNENAELGRNAGTLGVINVDGLGSQFNLDRNIVAGKSGRGILNIRSAGVVDADSLSLGSLAGSRGIVRVIGVGSELNLTGLLNVGSAGGALLNIESGAVVTSRNGRVGTAQNLTAEVLVTGLGSQWNINSDLDIGEYGVGGLRIESSGLVNSGDSDVGLFGAVTVTGAGSVWNTRDLSVYGMLDILGGSVVASSDFVRIDAGNDETAVVNISGGGSVLDVAGGISIGAWGRGVLNLNEAGVVNSSGEALLGLNGSATVNVNQAEWNHVGDLIIGAGYVVRSRGIVNIEAQGIVNVTGDVVTSVIDRGTGAIRFNNSTLNTNSLFAASALEGTGTINTNGLVSDLDLVFNPGNELQHQVLLNPITGHDITINLNTTSLDNPGALGVGYEGSGSILIEGGRVVRSREAFLGYGEESIGTATVTGPGSHWIVSGDNDRPGSTGGGTGDLYIGRNGSGTLLIENGGKVSNSNAYLGWEAAENYPPWRSSGSVTVTGAGSQLETLGEIFVGGHGAGQLNILDGGVVNAYQVILGSSDDGTGSLHVSGVGSRLSIVEDLISGGRGAGGLVTINNGGVVNTGDYTQLRGSGETTRTWTVSGAGSEWNIGRHFELNGGREKGVLLFLGDGAHINSDYISLEGSDSASWTKIRVTGSGTQINNDINIYLGWSSSAGEIAVDNGGVINNVGKIYVGGFYGNNEGLLSIGGDGSAVNIGEDLLVAYQRSTGTVTIEDGAQLSSANGYISEKSTSVGTVLVDGLGSQWNNAGFLRVGNDGEATLTIQNGAALTSGNGTSIAERSGSMGVVTVDGSEWNNTGDLTVGTEGVGVLNILNGGQVYSTGLTRIGHYAGDGTLNLNNGTLTTGGLLAPNSTLMGVGTINTHNLIADYDMVFDATSGARAQVTLNDSPGQDITINYDNFQPGFVDNASFLGAGYVDTGSISITGGVRIFTIDGYLGYAIGSNGTATITGQGSTWDIADSLSIGREGTGALNILAGGIVTSGMTSIGESVGSTGSVRVDGVGANWRVSDTLNVGENGDATLEIHNAAIVDSTSARVAVGSTTTGNVTVDGVGSRWNIEQDLSMGFAGTATLNIQNNAAVNVDGVTNLGGTLSSGQIQFNQGTLTTGGLLATNASLQGVGTVYTYNLVGDHDLVFNAASGPRQSITLDALPGQDVQIIYDNFQPSFVNTSSFLGAGYSAVGSIRIEDGVKISTDVGYLGYLNGAIGQATISGAGSRWDTTDDFFVGYFGTGELSIDNGGKLFIGSTAVAQATESADVVVSNYFVDSEEPGAPPTSNFGGQLYIQNGSILSNAENALLGDNRTEYGTANVSGVGSEWNIGQELFVGFNGYGTMRVIDGAFVSNTNGYLGYAYLAIGDVEVTGNGSVWHNKASLSVGLSGAGSLHIGEGGTVLVGLTAFDPNVGGASNSDGRGSDPSVDFDKALVVSDAFNADGTGTGGQLHVRNGGTLLTDHSSFGNAVLGALAGEFGYVTVSDAGSMWTNDGELHVGYRGNGDLNILDGGVVSTRRGYIGTTAGAVGTATVSGDGSTWIVEREFYLGGSDSGPSGAQATLNIQDNGLVHVYSRPMMVWDTATVNLDGGRLQAHQIDHTHGGTFNFIEGTLSVDNFYGTLEQFGGRLSPGNSIGSTSISGDYNLNEGTIEIELRSNGWNGSDEVNVTGALNLGSESGLWIRPIDDYLPEQGDRFTILNYSSINGQFGWISLPSLGEGLLWKTSGLYLDGSIEIVEGIQGDMDADGVLTEADITPFVQALTDPTTYAAAYPNVDPITRGDFNGDAMLTNADIKGFVDALNSIDTSGVPEPSSLALMGLCSFILAHRRRRIGLPSES